jgi:hypothetical protein
MISGEPVSAGSFAEVSEADGNLLIGSGKAVVALTAKKPAPVEVTEQAQPAPASAKPARKAKAVTSELPTKD